MMKHLTTAFILISVCLLPRIAAAQDAGQWVSVAPPDEKFRVEMPRKPSIKKQKSKADPQGDEAIAARVDPAGDNGRAGDKVHARPKGGTTGVAVHSD